MIFICTDNLEKLIHNEFISNNRIPVLFTAPECDCVSLMKDVFLERRNDKRSFRGCVFYFWAMVFRIQIVYFM